MNTTLNILFTTERGFVRDRYFPAGVIERLEKLGNVVYNPDDTPLTPEALASALGREGIEVCITHWGCPTFTEAVLSAAESLRLIVHAAGSVGDLVTAQVYERGIKVCSANRVLARHVAEGVLADFLAGLRLLPQLDHAMKNQLPDRALALSSRSLYGAKIGLVGLGTIGLYLLDLLAPFEAHIKVYDPYLDPAALAKWNRVELCARLDEVLAWGEIVSLHASLTAETRGLIDSAKLKLIRDGALFVNTARGAIVDEAALIEALESGRLNAVLDVYETEPLPADSPLRRLGNVILLPHVAGITASADMSCAMLEEIGRYARGEALHYEIPLEKFLLMTKER